MKKIIDNIDIYSLISTAYKVIKSSSDSEQDLMTMFFYYLTQEISSQMAENSKDNNYNTLKVSLLKDLDNEKGLVYEESPMVVSKKQLKEFKRLLENNKLEIKDFSRLLHIKLIVQTDSLFEQEETETFICNLFKEVDRYCSAQGIDQKKLNKEDLKTFFDKKKSDQTFIKNISEFCNYIFKYIRNAIGCVLGYSPHDNEANAPQPVTWEGLTNFHNKLKEQCINTLS